MRLELQQKQKQILTEQMIQSVEILQMTSQELKEYVNEVMLENPVVELDEHVNENTGTESIEERQQQTSAEEQYHYLTQRQSDDDDISDLKINGIRIQTTKKHCRIISGRSFYGRSTATGMRRF